MARKFLTPIDMNKLEIRQLLLEVIAGNPGSPIAGQVWYDSATERMGLRGSATTYKLVRDGGDLTAGSVANTALATNPLDRANHTGTQLASTVSNFDTQVRTSRLDQMAAPTASVAMGSQKLTGLANGSSASDSAAFGQIQAAIDAALAGLDWKEAVRCASTANIAALSGLLTIDGITVVANDRVLVKDQSTGSANGIYLAASGAWTRALDADTSAEIKDASVLVAGGTAHAGTQWKLTTDSVVLGTTAQVWVQHGAGAAAYTGGNGLTLTGNDFNVGAGTGITVDAANVNIDTAVVARWKTGLIGNGSSTSLAYNHALGNQWVTCQVVEVATLAEVDCDVVRTDANNVTITFAVAPASNAYRVIVAG